jgi:hypothetical protein
MIHEATHWDIRNLRVQELKGKKSLTYKPVSLTEEWLLKFGFERMADNLYEKNPLSISFPSTVEITCAHTWQTALVGYDISYVHQLQNLYFALTGEELTIKK